MPLSVLSLGPWVILSLKEGFVRGSEGVEPSWCILLDGVDELSQFGDTDRPFFYGIVSNQYWWGEYSCQDVSSVLETFQEEIDGFIIAYGVAR